MDPDGLSPGSGRPLHVRISSIALVFAGGAVGTLARYGLALAWPTESGRWPWGTFAANLIGCFVLGALLEALVRRGADVGARQQLRLLVGTGFCGGLTTYSTFAVEADLLVRAHSPVTAVAYLAATLVLGFLVSLAAIVLAAARGRRSGRTR
jgi:fluoride exporter